MFQQPTRDYRARFPGKPLRGDGSDALLVAAWERDVEAFELHWRAEAEALELPDAEKEPEGRGLLDEEGHGRGHRSSRTDPMLRSSLGNFLDEHLDEDRHTVLHVATYRGATKIVRLILDNLPPQGKGRKRRAHPLLDARSCLGTSALHLACRRNRTNITRLLLRAGANIGSRDNNGNTPLHFGVEANSADVVEFAISNRLPFDLPNAASVTPLFLACQLAFRGLAVRLASAGADICKLNNFGKTPLLEAQDQGWGEELRCAGAVPEKPASPDIMHQTDARVTYQWNTPQGRSAPVQFYRLQVRKIDRLNPNAPWVTVADNVKEKRHTFHVCKAHCRTFERDASPQDLEPSEVYTVRVSAWSIVGWSEPSEPSKVLVTAPAAPCRPEPPAMVTTTNTSITLRWVHPDENGAPIQESELQWRMAHTPYVKWSTIAHPIKVHQPADSCNEASSSESDTDDEEEPLKLVKFSEFTVRELAPQTFYKFRVRCRNLMGWSYFSLSSLKVRTRTESCQRRKNFAFGANGQVRKALHGTLLHAEARFIAVDRGLHDDTTREFLRDESDRQFRRNRTETQAAVKLQTFLRGLWAASKFAQFKRDKVQRRPFLVEYNLEAEFLAQWRKQLLYYKHQSLAIAAEQQQHANCRRLRKMERSARRQRRQLVRKQRDESLRPVAHALSANTG
ncbi:Ankyrin repeat domain-containing protein 6 (Diversin) [Durusdinium trenchii]|uniref:Ankyrin repeat domain-containing protein 6 (Diversin) n=1 Tax=Durusdinium trenchii TaxID=1381693 RepID=A0ABP0RM69_9DINO